MSRRPAISNCLFKATAGLKYAIIEGLVFAVIAGIVTDLLSFRYDVRIWTVKICAVIGMLSGLRFGIRLSRYPSENPRGQHFFYSVVLIVGILNLLMFAAILMTGTIRGMVSEQSGPMQVSPIRDTVSYLFFSALWFTSGILGVGVGLAGLQLPMKLIPSSFQREGLVGRTWNNWHNLPEVIKILVLFGSYPYRYSFWLSQQL